MNRLNASGSQLTEERKQMVVENIKLANYAASKFKPPIGMDHDDWYQECLIMLCKIAVKFDETGSAKLSTYYMESIWRKRSEIFRANTRANRDIRKTKPFGHELDYFVNSRSEAWEALVKLVDSESFERVDNLIRLLPKDSWKQIARMKADGISEKLISQKLGVTVLSVRSAWGRALRFLRKFLAEKAQAA